jgi:hypothetical protein
MTGAPASYLPSYAALLAFLAQHPDLAVPPLEWSVISDGSLYVSLPDGPDGLPFLHQLAAATGVEVREGRPFFSARRGEHRVLHHVDAVVSGLGLSGAVSVPAAEGGAE